jgi:hypothetical protein
LRRTIQRQLSPKLTFALTGTTAEAHHGLPIARCLTDGSNMRIADQRPAGEIFRPKQVLTQIAYRQLSDNAGEERLEEMLLF